MTDTPDEEKREKVFISYSWTTPEHVERVMDLARSLMHDGIDVVIDKWDLEQGMISMHLWRKW
ncbi:SEFIR domain-containing protein [Listeria booriae]|uniref:SEFIR domain-containing protein n=1 Tax=Listeria booriae TaxID=1552123 RepID=UPI001C89CAB8|nr:SEFIR domain-containing protein [Listeria booriae]